MDLDKLIVFAGKFGFAGVVAVWFMWKVQGFMESLVSQGAIQTELLRQLIMLHQK